ncbi:hypothetical protein [Bradyrhizobium pachyrhizi]|uniref:hypothetical protein n=1 Tax=Bradyrhizobium pachyrhizi TaxID=280333 RepID=UPI001364DB59|nr:hypothetical protein [Bradyrhizobium pachyrhizi]
MRNHLPDANTKLGSEGIPEDSSSAKSAATSRLSSLIGRGLSSKAKRRPKMRTPIAWLITLLLKKV